jgi:hypothetical protein
MLALSFERRYHRLIKGYAKSEETVFKPRRSIRKLVRNVGDQTLTPARKFGLKGEKSGFEAKLASSQI